MVDLKEDHKGTPLVTEVNIRHVAFTPAFAMAGFNFTEYQLLCILGRENECIIKLEKEFPSNNIMLREVNGLPIYLENFKELGVGQSYNKRYNL